MWLTRSSPTQANEAQGSPSSSSTNPSNDLGTVYVWMSSTLFGWLIHGIRPHADATNTDQKWPSYRSGSRISILVLSATSSIRGRIFCTNAQFGLASLWRKAKNGVHSANCQGPSGRSISDRLGLWQIIHALGSNTKS